MDNDLLSRKFLFAILVVVLSFILVFIGKITSTEWVGFVEIIGGIYVIGNVASGVTDAISKPNSTTTTSTTSSTTPTA
jgi:hypothetical protein